MSQEHTGTSVLSMPERAVPAGRDGAGRIRQVIFKYLQPAMLAAIVAFWWLGPRWLIESNWTAIASGYVVMVTIMALEWVNERHAHWRLTWREAGEGLFYVLLNRYVIAAIATLIFFDPVQSLRDRIGLGNIHWAMDLPFPAQIAMILVLHEFVQYWFHRLMHSHPALWAGHEPHHFLTQLNTMNAQVGNWAENIFLGISLVIFFDMPKEALLCAGNVGGAISYFAHSNIRFDPPRWYSFFFTTIEHHSLHHSTEYDDTRHNYANELIFLDRIFGTYREGDSANVGQENQRRLSVWEQSIWPLVRYAQSRKSS